MFIYSIASAYFISHITHNDFVHWKADRFEKVLFDFDPKVISAVKQVANFGNSLTETLVT